MVETTASHCVVSTSLEITRVVWPAGQEIHRIHLDIYAADDFNPGVRGNARFSPIQSSTKVAIPTLYGGDTFDCAAMETVFHDVPFTGGLKQHDKNRLAGHIYSKLKPQADLTLVDLSVVALRNLGIRRAQLIDTDSTHYPMTRAWAKAFHSQFSDVQGLQWISRQDDRARAIILFGDRIKKSDLLDAGDSRNILADSATYANILVLARTIGVFLVDGRAAHP